MAESEKALMPIGTGKLALRALQSEIETTWDVKEILENESGYLSSPGELSDIKASIQIMREFCEAALQRDQYRVYELIRDHLTDWWRGVKTTNVDYVGVSWDIDDNASLILEVTHGGQSLLWALRRDFILFMRPNLQEGARKLLGKDTDMVTINELVQVAGLPRSTTYYRIERAIDEGKIQNVGKVGGTRVLPLEEALEIVKTPLTRGPKPKK